MKGKGREGRFEGERKREERRRLFFWKEEGKWWVTRRRLNHYIDRWSGQTFPKLGSCHDNMFIPLHLVFGIITSPVTFFFYYRFKSSILLSTKGWQGLSIVSLVAEPNSMMGTMVSQLPSPLFLARWPLYLFINHSFCIGWLPSGR